MFNHGCSKTIYTLRLDRIQFIGRPRHLVGDLKSDTALLLKEKCFWQSQDPLQKSLRALKSHRNSCSPHGNQKVPPIITKSTWNTAKNIQKRKRKPSFSCKMLDHSMTSHLHPSPNKCSLSKLLRLRRKWKPSSQDSPFVQMLPLHWLLLSPPDPQLYPAQTIESHTTKEKR